MFYLSLVAVLKEETKWLKEWLEYHLLVGVEHFYLFLHDSGEELRKVKEIIRWYHPEKITYYPFNYHSGDFQIMAYDLALKNYGKDNVWMGFIDLDEFVFPVRPVFLLPEILQQYEDNTIKGLNTSVCTFGDSYNKSSPILQTRDLTWRAFDYRPCNCTAKQFFRTNLPDSIKDYVYGGNWWECVNEDGNLASHCKMIRPMTKIRVNHYPVRSTEDWNKKRERNWPDDKPLHTLTSLDWMKKLTALNQNDIKDDSMERFVPYLENKLIELEERIKIGLNPICSV